MTDTAVFRPDTAQWLIALRDASGNIIGTRIYDFGATGMTDLPVSGDFDGNGVTDTAVFRPDTAQWLIGLRDASGNAIGARVISFGATGLKDIPIPGDYDGNGVTDLAVFNPSSATWMINLQDSSGNTIGSRTYTFARPGWTISRSPATSTATA